MSTPLESYKSTTTAFDSDTLEPAPKVPAGFGRAILYFLIGVAFLIGIIVFIYDQVSSRKS